MFRKVFRTGNRVMISLPRAALEYLDNHVGAEVEIHLDHENRQVILRPVEMPLVISGVDENFAHQVAT